MSILSELVDELRSLASGRAGIADGVLPPVVFAVVNLLTDVSTAAWAGAGVAGAIVAWRLARRRPLKFALSGLAGTLLATALALRSGRAETFFLPGIVTGAVSTALITVSLLTRRPFVAFTSWTARNWPLEWYWHPRVLPAYMSVTWLWAAYFAVRTGAAWWLYETEQVELLAAFRVATGWPTLAVLLTVTYVWGRRRLIALEGPSVEEFEAGQPPPWRGQQRGF